MPTGAKEGDSLSPSVVVNIEGETRGRRSFIHPPSLSYALILSKEKKVLIWCEGLMKIMIVVIIIKLF